MSEPLLQVEGLCVRFAAAPAGALAIDALGFAIRKGETLALVGESGCGKSLTALSLMGLLPKPDAQVVAGRILLGNEDLAAASPARMRQVRGGRLGMIFQEPMTALNPVMRVGDQIAESLREHEGLSVRQARDAAVDLLGQVGIPDPRRRVEDFPHRLSGGMRQRVIIAMAIACKPDLLIADEPTTALDVTVQLQILDLLRKLRAERGMSLLIITHDLGVVAALADRVIVMYAGRKVEEAPVADIFAAPRHPYTQGLLAAMPGTRGDAQDWDTPPRLHEIPGTVPSVLGRARGCAFAGRCARAEARCSELVPGLPRFVHDHAAACHRLEEAIA